MWNGGEDVNDEGEPIRLYQPILYGRKPELDDPFSSFIGGDTIHPGGGDLICPICNTPLEMLVQLHVPESPPRTYQVLACKKASCTRQVFGEGQKLSFGGSQVYRCRSVPCVAPKPVPRVPTTPAPAVPESNEWDMTADDGTMDALEAKLAAMEAAPTQKAAAPPAKSKSPKGSRLPAFLLHSLNEPGGLSQEGMDEDDVGLAEGNDKIQAMLERYMAEEEDEEILNALRGSSGGGGREKDQRLSATDRALFTYTDRLKRSPRQVLRYARGGEPLWSMYVSSPKLASRMGISHLCHQPGCLGTQGQELTVGGPVGTHSTLCLWIPSSL